MISVEVAVTIRRPRSEVAAVMFNPRYDTAWIARLKQVRPAKPGPLCRGSEVERVSRVLGRRVAQRIEVVEHVPDRSIELRTQYPHELRIRYELEGIPEGTIARIRTHDSTHRWPRLITPVLNRLLRRTAIRDLGRLKVLLESGAWRRLAK